MKADASKGAQLPKTNGDGCRCCVEELEGGNKKKKKWLKGIFRRAIEDEIPSTPLRQRFKFRVEVNGGFFFQESDDLVFPGSWFCFGLVLFIFILFWVLRL